MPPNLTFRTNKRFYSFPIHRTMAGGGVKGTRSRNRAMPAASVVDALLSILIPIIGCATIGGFRAQLGVGVMTESVSRRSAMKSIVVVVGGVATTVMLPGRWTRPLIDSVIVPANAATLSPAAASISVSESISEASVDAQQARNMSSQAASIDASRSAAASSSSTCTLAPDICSANASASAAAD
jgi:hypothetical protein